jgi:chromosome segregation ATPase
VSSTLSNPNVAAPLRPLAETAALFRQECLALDHLVEELFRDVERLRDEVLKKGDELDEGRRKLAERGRQLAEQRKESSRLVQLLEQQETRLAEALGEIKSLREQSGRERDEARERETTRFSFLEQKIRATEAERDQVRHELHVLQATAAANGGSTGGVESLAPLMTELGDMRRQLTEAILHSASSAGHSAEAPAPLMTELGEMRRQLGETQTQLGEARTQLAEAIEKAAKAAASAAPVIVNGDGQPADEQTLGRLASMEKERVELESELELVRTRATELQEVVNQQRRELVEQRADVTTELRLLRELMESRRVVNGSEFESEEEAMVAASARGEPSGSSPDPVVSSVMAQFARLQKDVAQRRKKK